MSARGSHSPPPPDHETGVPGLRTWRGVYAFVLGTFVVIVALLAVFARTFR
jgi:hypothetical protein